MLLRRITQHVKDQNWFAIGIDFFIVVIGVFIGIQVSNWNEARTDSMREKVVLADLLDDLKADQASVSSSLQLVTLGIDAGNVLLLDADLEPIQSLSVPPPSGIFLSDEALNVALPSQPTDDFRRELWTYSIMRLYPSHNDGTIESLIAADNSSIIQNEALVRDLLRYRTLWTGLEDAQINTFRPFRDRIVFAGQEHGFSPLTSIDHDVLVEALRTDPALRGALRTMINFSILQLGYYELMQYESAALATRVEAELKK